MTPTEEAAFIALWEQALETSQRLNVLTYTRSGAVVEGAERPTIIDAVTDV
jgi:hypothetical protein